MKKLIPTKTEKEIIEFCKVWNSALSRKEVESKLHISGPAASVRAGLFRSMGIECKKFKRGRWAIRAVVVDELNKEINK